MAKTEPDRQLIHSRDAEQAVLGSMLRDNRVIDEMILRLQPSDFYFDAHVRIFRAAIDLWNQDRPVDLVTLADELHRRGEVKDAGGYDYLPQLLAAAPTAANAGQYASIVRDRSLLRGLSHVGAEISQDAERPTGPAEDLIARAEQKVFALADTGLGGDVVLLADTVDEALDRIDRRGTTGNSCNGLPTGLGDLDALTCGLQDGEYILVAARTSVGKTAFAVGVAHQAAVAQNLPVLYVSLEQSTAGLTERLLCYDSGVDAHHVRTGRLRDDDAEKLLESRARLRNAKLIIDAAAGQTVSRIAAMARFMRRKHGIRLLLVDYVQIIAAEDRRANRNDQVGAISQRLQHLSRELNIPVVVLCQLNRASESGERPRLSHLRESGSLEQDADVVLLMHRPNKDQEEQQGSLTNLVEVEVAKNRDGRTGIVTLTFRRPCMRFETFSKDADPFTDAGEAG